MKREAIFQINDNGDNDIVVTMCSDEAQSIVIRQGSCAVTLPKSAINELFGAIQYAAQYKTY
jgi:hypothetical protein